MYVTGLMCVLVGHVSASKVGFVMVVMGTHVKVISGDIESFSIKVGNARIASWLEE